MVEPQFKLVLLLLLHIWCLTNWPGGWVYINMAVEASGDSVGKSDMCVSRHHLLFKGWSEPLLIFLESSLAIWSHRCCSIYSWVNIASLGVMLLEKFCPLMSTCETCEGLSSVSRHVSLCGGSYPARTPIFSLSGKAKGLTGDCMWMIYAEHLSPL